MKKFRGHLFNWYDTQTLKPMLPQYVSTVDSGNFVGHVLTLRSGLYALLTQKILAGRIREGLIDSLRILADVIHEGNAKHTGNQRYPAISDTLVMIDRMQIELQSGPSTLKDTQNLLSRLSDESEDLITRLGNDADAEIVWWVKACQRQCQDFQNELAAFVPWLSIPIPAENLWNQGPPELTET